MNDPIKSGGRKARWAAPAGLLAVGAIGGAVLAGTLSANAATTPSPASSSSSSPVDPATHMRGNFPAHGTAAHEALEKAVTGSNAAKAQAAAVKAVGSGTAGAVTSDASGTGYEVTVTKADGSTAEVHLDGSFGVEDHGGPGGH
jgi:hypothetical protein